MISNIINTVLSLILAGFITYVLLSYDKTLTFIERFGLALWCVGALFSIGALWMRDVVTPYSVWYQWVWRLGGVLYMSGRVRRLRRHDATGRLAKDIAGTWVAEHPRVRP